MKTDFILVSIKEKALYKAFGVYKNEHDAYATAIVWQMQSIEKSSEKWPKSVLVENQENIIELCRCIKQDLKSFKERFEYMTAKSSQIFSNLEFTHYQVLAIETNNSSIPSESISESIFKTKVRNFMDVLQTRSDVEEDLGNSDDDDEDDEEEEEEEEEEDDDEEEEEEGEEEEENEDEQDIQGQEHDTEEEDADDIEQEEDDDQEQEAVTSETAIREQSEGEDEDLEDQERPSLKRAASSLLDDGDAEEDEEEDEIDEEDDADEDELADDDDESVKRRRVMK